ncbi:hypothetical protein DTO166G4_6288 [Paecilomyces variotii]|nr:hypothetical protein DTO164E3_8459 [Paecilomyces variotii]KAJ9195945.1 hypothetical protein DTO032I3_6652 [Paecilomyces variotii]KAJ9212132.1 hypothetical protein DTO166G4_6288 [Paecilomyces variotii]KAJ9219883.1 hypothetical protein DTO169C6_7758 [Paecilomyces variotii]KAJ9236094.1 hypothetical protein DTO169E5_5917 [Paecilomyces variotii]
MGCDPYLPVAPFRLANHRLVAAPSSPTPSFSSSSISPSPTTASSSAQPASLSSQPVEGTTSRRDLNPPQDVEPSSTVRPRIQVPYNPPSPPRATGTSRRRGQEEDGRYSLFGAIRLGSQSAVARQPASRLWNPINYVPRTTPVAIPRPQQQLSDEHLPIEAHRDAYPLLTIPEQRRSRQNPSPSSLAVERSICESESGRTSIGLPPGHRRSGNWEETVREEMTAQTSANRQENDLPGRPEPLHLRQDGGRGPEDVRVAQPRHVQSQVSLRSQTFASLPSPTGNHTSGGGTTGEGDPGEELAWGPAHPCFPHLNPHVPIASDEYLATRIIRIRRDWMVKGDLAPTFSNLYPEILDPLLSEQEFRSVISKVNSELIKAFDPYNLRNWFDGAMGLLTGWVWDDLGATGIKSHLRHLEDWLENWNREVGAKEGVRIWPLRRTAYMSLDIQIPDPKVGIVTDAPSLSGTRTSSGLGPVDPHAR